MLFIYKRFSKKVLNPREMFIMLMLKVSGKIGGRVGDLARGLKHF